MARPSFMPIDEFCELGYLQELNRRFLHPLGLALAVREVDGKRELAGVLDARDDPEGFVFEFEPSELDDARVKSARIQTLLEQRASRRRRSLGFTTQPIA